ncbi:ABC transporter ATP-binding protein, partial [Actinoplanes subtropicus]|uniref:ABC transporter ATP-binding protein n=1 Tax=Actinoplanes subtropicus TaxID=543632 RepID=UPI0004C33A83
MITFDDVVKVYPGGSTAVDHLSLELPTGRTTVFVGPSGCGKTTSLRMINRMISPTSGRILIDGKDVAGQDEAVLRRGIGYVIQHAGLFPHRTVLDNVATVPMLLGKTRREARAAALELLDRVGLAAEFAGRYPAQLSGGQQQRVGVARALAADPPVMLMDEPFSAVDPVVREGLHREFLRLQKDLGKTIAMVTHDIDEAIKLGDVVAIFRQGGVLAQVGTPQELLTQPADEFVAEFVGRDRGLRSLSFESAAGLPVRPVAEAPEVLLDDAGRPQDAATFTQEDSLRLVTDLTITSPTGIAVRVGPDGKADGIVSHHDIADHIARIKGQK